LVFFLFSFIPFFFFLLFLLFFFARKPLRLCAVDEQSHRQCRDWTAMRALRHNETGPRQPQAGLLTMLTPKSTTCSPLLVQAITAHENTSLLLKRPRVQATPIEARSKLFFCGSGIIPLHDNQVRKSAPCAGEAPRNIRSVCVQGPK